MKKRLPINISTMNKYVKSKFGRLATGVSLYSLVSAALAKDGLECPEGTADRKWVLANALFIRTAVQGVKKSASPVVLVSNVDVKTRDFLDTYEWRRVRMVAIKKYGAVCQCCGASPKTGAVINVDHIKPRKIFPELALDVENLQVLCHECNHGKGNWDMTDWRLAEA